MQACCTHAPSVQCICTTTRSCAKVLHRESSHGFVCVYCSILVEYYKASADILLACCDDGTGLADAAQNTSRDRLIALKTIHCCRSEPRSSKMTDAPAIPGQRSHLFADTNIAPSNILGVTQGFDRTMRTLSGSVCLNAPHKGPGSSKMFGGCFVPAGDGASVGRCSRHQSHPAVPSGCMVGASTFHLLWNASRACRAIYRS